MRILVKIADLLVVSNLYVASGTYALTWLTLQFYDCPNTDVLWFVFFSTLFAYNFMRLLRVRPMLQEGDSLRHKNIFYYKPFLWIFTFISALLSFLFFCQIYHYAFYTLLFIGLISIVYSLPVYKIGDLWYRFRDIPSLKIFLISFVWTVATSLLPMLVCEVSIDWSRVLERFLFVFAITIPFDIRDLSFDAERLATLPQLLGQKKSKILGVSALVLAELILFYDYFFRDLYSLSAMLFIYLSYECSIYMVYNSRADLPERFFTMGVEGMSILVGLFFYLSKFLL